MALTAVYMPDLSRMRITGTSMGATAVTVTVTRSVNNFISSDIVRGANRMPMSAAAFTVDDYEFPPGVPVQYRAVSYNSGGVVQVTVTSTAVTQALTEVWLKVPAAPYLNRAVTVVEAGDITRPARVQLFEPIGRSYPVAVSDIRSSRRFDVKLRTFNAAQEATLDYTMASGEIIYLHVDPSNLCMQGGYFSVGDVTWGPPGSRARPERVFNLPLTEVAAPGPDVVASTYTWQSTLSEYTTWTGLLAANASWSALLQRVASPSDVIVT